MRQLQRFRRFRADCHQSRRWPPDVADAGHDVDVDDLDDCAGQPMEAGRQQSYLSGQRIVQWMRAVMMAMV